MKDYTLYFSLFGKKMKTTITAETQAEAELKLRSKIRIEKVVSSEVEMNPFGLPDDLMDALGMKRKKP